MVKKNDPTSGYGKLWEKMSLKYKTTLMIGFFVTLFTIIFLFSENLLYIFFIELPAEVVMGWITPDVVGRLLNHTNNCDFYCGPTILGYISIILVWTLFGFIMGWIIESGIPKRK